METTITEIETIVKTLRAEKVWTPWLGNAISALNAANDNLRSHQTSVQTPPPVNTAPASN